MKPTGWKRARRGFSAYASESDTTNLSGGSIINSGLSGLGYNVSRIIIAYKY
jgi:hypothetical protein